MKSYVLVAVSVVAVAGCRPSAPPAPAAGLSPRIVVLNAAEDGQRDLEVALVNPTDEEVSVYSPVSFRNCLIVEEDGTPVPFVAPEDDQLATIPGETTVVGDYVPVRPRSLVTFRIKVDDGYTWTGVEDGKHVCHLVYNVGSGAKDSWKQAAASSPIPGLTKSNPFVVVVAKGHATFSYRTESQVRLDGGK